MPTELIRAPGRGLSRAERKQAAVLRQAQVPARIAAAKIEGAAFAAHVAMTHASMLSAAEERAIKVAPLGEARFKAIADAYAGYACQELSLLAFK